MYGYDYTPATEGISSWFKNIVETVGRKIREVTEFLRRHITELGKKLKTKKKEFLENEGEAKELINSISRKTYDILDCCDSIIDEMYVDYLSIGKVETSIEPHHTHSFSNVTLHYYDNKTHEMKREKYNQGGTISENRSFKFEPGKMQKGDDTSDDDWNKFQNKIGELFESMHDEVDKIKQDLTKLQNMPHLSYNTTLEGYKKLKGLYDINGDFSKHWDKLRTAHEFADPNGRIKKALSKIISLYNVGASAAKAFAVRLNTGNFKNDKGKNYRKGDEIYNKAKDEVKNIGEVSDKRTPNSDSKTTTDRYTHFQPLYSFEYDHMGRYFNYKGEYKDAKYTKESAILSRLYDMAYEDARRDLEMRSQYIEAFENVPDTFDEFDI